MRSNCPISYSLEIFGDKWSLLILRDVLFSDKRTFKEFSESKEGIATNILSSRLIKLVDEGFLTKEQSTENKKVNLFVPTERAWTLLPVFLQISKWAVQDNEDLNSKETRKAIKALEKAIT